MNRLKLLVLLLIATACAVAAFARAPLAPSSMQSLTIYQRTTQALPGSSELLLTIGDIAAGQTMVSLEWRDRERVRGPCSLRANESVDFDVAGERLLLTLAHLHNELIGNDWAEFTLARAEGPTLQPTAASDPSAMSAAQEIEALIKAVASQNGAVFIRNGSEHSASDAADHLRRKLRSAGSRVNTADQFIEHIASKSSTSGNPYALRLANGKTVDAGEWFRARLAEIRGER